MVTVEELDAIEEHTRSAMSARGERFSRSVENVAYPEARTILYLVAEIRSLLLTNKPEGDWTDDECRCDICGALMELVRPGKHQPVCDCYE